MTSPSPSVGDRRARLRGALGWVLLAAASLAAFLVVGRAGNEAAARGARVLGALDPVFELFLRGGGAALEGLVLHARAVAIAVSAAALLVSAAAAAAVRTRAGPVHLLVAAVCCGVWAQESFVVGLPARGWLLYGAGFVLAVVLGVLRPMSRLPGFPELPAFTKESGDGAPAAAGPGAPGAAELSGLFALVVLGLVVRAWALMELPDGFDPEMVGVMTAGRTLLGFRDYLVTELLGTGNGVFHVLVHRALYALFGTSIYAVRLTALFWGVSAIPLAYALARRLAGVWPAFAAGLLFATAPEQLFWSRNENAFFAPVAALALVTAHLTLSMVRRFSAGATLAAALFMPVSRFVYTPAFVMFSLPPLALAHAAVFVKGAWRRLLVAGPLLLLGLGLWVFSLSAAVSWVKGERLFVHPAKVRGVEAWKHDVPAGTGALGVARIQASRVARNTETVVRGFVVHADYTTHWCRRFLVSPDLNTSIPMGLAVVVLLGVGWLLGQLRDRRAALLLIWIGVGLLPGTMSDEPEARRIALVFPAFSVTAALVLAGAARTVREAAGAAVARVAGALLGAAVVALSGAALASHLLLPKQSLREEEQVRFAAPLFASADTVLHNLFYRSGRVVAFGNLDRLLDPTRPVCTQYLDPKDYLEAALLPVCSFTDVPFPQLLSGAETDALRTKHRPRRIGFLLTETPQGKRLVELLTSLFPQASVRRKAFDGSEPMTAIEVEAEAFAALRSPEVAADGTVTGGLYVREPGWYRFRLEPPCAGTTLDVAGAWEPTAEGRPFLAGVLPFEIRPPKSGACPPPMRVVALRPEAAGDPGEEALLLSPRVAAVPGAAGRTAPAFPGYGPSAPFASFPGIPVDAGVDARGRVHVLLWTGSAFQLLRLAPDGSVERTLTPDLPGLPGWAGLSVAPDGSVLATGEKEVRLYAPDGTVAASWRTPFDQTPNDATFLPDGRIAFVFRDRRTVELFSTAGARLGGFGFFDGGRGRFLSPVGLAVAPDGRLLVTEETGQALLFGPPGPDGAATYLAEFTIDFAEDIRAGELRGTTFDGNGRILAPQRSLHFPLVYTVSGERLLAATPGRDLSSRRFADASRFVAAKDALYVVDAESRRLWKVER